MGGDDATFGDDDQVQNIYDLRNERSLSTNDIRHRLIISPIYELPFGKGKRWFQSDFLNQAFGGWSLSTIATLQSGSPFGVTVLNGPRDILGDNADGKNLRPNIVGDLRLPDSQKGQPATGGVRGIQWFNPAAVKLMSLLPTPTSAAATRNFVFNPTVQQRTDQFDVRLDQNLGSSDRFFFKYSYDDTNLIQPGSLPSPDDQLSKVNLEHFLNPVRTRLPQLVIPKLLVFS